jgi:hypothetical protein
MSRINLLLLLRIIKRKHEFLHDLILSTITRHCLIYALTLDNILNVVLSAYVYHGIPSLAFRQSSWLGLIQA